jgi:metallophosphoesterase superfamily enzyme
VIFLGDFIDRGGSLYEHKELLGIVMKMVRAGNALSVMGNHEFDSLKNI